MEGKEVYNVRDEVIRKLLAELTGNLDNSIPSEGISKGADDMPKRLSEKVIVEGRERWIHGYSMQELFDNYVKMLVNEGLIEWVEDDDNVPMFGNYLREYYANFKQNQQSNTVVNRNRTIRNFVEPNFGNKRLDRIRTMDIQKWFNSLARKYSKETILKIKNVMSPVFDAAVEDMILDRNPMASKRIEIHGKETVHHKAIPKEKMEEIRLGLNGMEERERNMGALLCYTGMRFEEILGLRWEDIDFYQKLQITVRRAVIHPNRNMPEIKCPKTKTSERVIPMAQGLFSLIFYSSHKTGFVVWSNKDETRETPLSYTEARRMFDKIRKRFSIEEYTAHDFRDTCATEWRENGMPLDVVARLLGHAKTETTERRYVKYRNDIMEKAREMM